MPAPHMYTLWSTLNLNVMQYEQTCAILSEHTYTYVVAQLVEVLCYEPEGCEFNS
jgi:hypothetical protein